MVAVVIVSSVLSVFGEIPRDNCQIASRFLLIVRVRTRCVLRKTLFFLQGKAKLWTNMEPKEQNDFLISSRSVAEGIGYARLLGIG